MTTSRDELFCRLAIRQGILSKEEATDVLRAYRAEGKVAEGIGKFAVREGFLESDVAGALENAIAHRAEGHVAESRKRVPKARSAAGGGGEGRHHHHHVHRATHRGSARDASPTQLAGVAIGAVVLIGAVIFLIIKLNPSSGTSPADMVKDPGKSTSQPADSGEVKKFESDVLKKPVEISLSPKERENFENRVSMALTTASQEASDGRYWRAVVVLRESVTELGGEQAPQVVQDLIAKLKERETEFLGLVDERYQELLVELKEAQTPEDAQGVLEDIKRACGPEKRQLAEASAPKDG